MDTKAEEHTNFITDIRFRPNSTQLATSSSDGTVRLWNAVEVFSSTMHVTGLKAAQCCDVGFLKDVM